MAILIKIYLWDLRCPSSRQAHRFAILFSRFE